MVENKLVSFAAVVVLRTLEILLIKLIRILLRWKYIYMTKIMPFSSLYFQSKAILSKKFSFPLPGLEYSYGKIFIPFPRDLGPSF